MIQNKIFSDIPLDLRTAPWLERLLNLFQEQAQIIREQGQVLQKQAEQITNLKQTIQELRDEVNRLKKWWLTWRSASVNAIEYPLWLRHDDLWRGQTP
jgi:hypothetical protein